MGSKAADKSSKVRAVTLPLFILTMISLCTYNSTDSVELCLLSLPASPCLCLPLPISACLSLSLSASPCLFLPLPLSVCLSLSLPASPCLFLPIPVSAYLFLSLPASFHPYPCLHLLHIPVSAASPCLSVSFPHSPCLCLPIPVSSRLYLSLTASPCFCPLLCVSACLSLS